MADEAGMIVLPDLFELAGSPQNIAWQRFRDGIDIYPLYTSETGCSAALLRYTDSACLPPHTHTGYEHILVLDGAQQDEHGRYERGTLLISPPGTTHSVSSDKGCIVFAVWEKPVHFL